MKLDDATFRRLRRLAPVLEDVLASGEVERADQAIDLEALAQLCSQLVGSYDDRYPVEIAQARAEANQSQ